MPSASGLVRGPAARGFLLGDRYELLDRIGAGGFSEVWRGTDVVLGRPVAVKLLHPGHMRHAEARTRFRDEARHAGRLAHGNIARIYDYGEQAPPGPPFLVMELVDGPSLADVLAAGALSPARSMAIVAQTASGLHAAHSAGVVHRDIKPGNLLLTSGGDVRITDFGISRAAGSEPVTSTGMLVGTPGYLAPERVSGAQATPASDLYALGVVAYECLAGAPPFAGAALEVAAAHRERPLPPLPRSVPPGVVALVAELTAKDPAARPRSAGEVARRAGEMADRREADITQPVPVRWPVPDGRGQGLAISSAPVAGQPARERARCGWPRSRRGCPEPRRRRVARKLGRAIVPATSAAMAVVAAAVIGSTVSSGPAPHAAVVPSVTPSGPASPATSRITMVDVRLGALVGQPVTVAARRLRQQHLSVRVVWLAGGGQAQGTVLSVRPVGRRPTGSLVTLTAAAPVPARAGDRHRDGKPDGGRHAKDHRRHGNEDRRGGGLRPRPPPG